MAVSSPSSAQNIPTNAHAEKYGTGWLCDDGYRESNNKCVKIKVPKNAFATGRLYDRGWECLRGFKHMGEKCVPVFVPKHAYLDDTGNTWNCERGYKEQKTHAF